MEFGGHGLAVVLAAHPQGGFVAGAAQGGGVVGHGGGVVGQGGDVVGQGGRVVGHGGGVVGQGAGVVTQGAGVVTGSQGGSVGISSISHGVVSRIHGIGGSGVVQPCGQYLGRMQCPRWRTYPGRQTQLGTVLLVKVQASPVQSSKQVGSQQIFLRTCNWFIGQTPGNEGWDYIHR